MLCGRSGIESIEGWRSTEWGFQDDKDWRGFEKHGPVKKDGREDSRAGQDGGLPGNLRPYESDQSIVKAFRQNGWDSRKDRCQPSLRGQHESPEYKTTRTACLNRLTHPSGKMTSKAWITSCSLVKTFKNYFQILAERVNWIGGWCSFTVSVLGIVIYCDKGVRSWFRNPKKNGRNIWIFPGNFPPYPFHNSRAYSLRKQMWTFAIFAITNDGVQHSTCDIRGWCEAHRICISSTVSARTANTVNGHIFCVAFNPTDFFECDSI